MNELIEKHSVDGGMYVYLQRNSKIWLARFKIDGKWISRTTKQRNRSDAEKASLKILAEYEFKAKHGIAIQNKSFRDIALLAIERMMTQPKATKGYASLNDYKQMLTRYHIPFFDRTHITSIDYERLAEFDAWRATKLGRTPSQSTLKMHNAALQRVFDEAVIRKWILPSRVPSLSSASGIASKRRDYFTSDELDKIHRAFPAWIEESRKQVTRETRQLLYWYFNFALHTGIRPGSEMDNLRWSDIKVVDRNLAEGEAAHIVITIRKGKTTLHTGPRLVVGHENLMEMILDMHSRSHDGETEEVPDDYDPLVFRLPDGGTTDQLGRNFSALLRKVGLEKGADGNRTLYSLRHTYITHRRLDKVPVEAIAKQCGTSVAMIELHYSHITPLMYKRELLGSESAALTKLIRKYSDLDS